MSKIVEKIRKILAKAQDSACTEAEAASLAARAAALMMEHSVSHADLAQEEPDSIVRLEYGPHYADPWRRSLVFACAELYLCRAINSETTYKTQRGRTRVRRSFLFVGREHHTIVAQEMCDYMISTVQRLARDYASSHEPQDRRRAQLGFERGCGERLADRVHALAQSRQEQVDSSPDSSTALLVRGERQLVDDWIEENLQLTRMRTQGSSINIDGLVGAARAESIGLDTQVPTTATAAGRLLS